jgi:hypothetical protein
VGLVHRWGLALRLVCRSLRVRLMGRVCVVRWAGSVGRGGVGVVCVGLRRGGCGHGGRPGHVGRCCVF